MKSVFITSFIVAVLSLCSCSARSLNQTDPGVIRTIQEETPESLGFVDIKNVNSDILVEAAYYTDWNFIGRPLVGYSANKCYLTKAAAEALSDVQKEVTKSGYSILAFDCYRPQRTVTEFGRWVQDSKDEKMKTIFYPEEPKSTLIKRGYIASRSGHSRGSTIDLTIVETSKFNSQSFQSLVRTIKDCRQAKALEALGLIDMGTTFDCFSVLANTANPKISSEAQKHRQILKEAMERYGFKNYSKEWWHYTLKNETNKDQFFNFEVK